MLRKMLCFLLLSALLAVLPLSLFGCADEVTVEEVYDRVIDLVERANAVNPVIYGAGLSVYRTGSDYALLEHLYDTDFYDRGVYEYVTPDANFASEDEILAALRAVYSADYIESVLAPTLFTGYADASVGGVSYGRYRTDEHGSFLQIVDAGDGKDRFTLYTEERVYDYSTLAVVSSDGDRVTLSVDSHLPSAPDRIESVTLRLSRQNGEWFLDSFTGG